MPTLRLDHVRSALYVPGSNARALEKARGLPADMIIVDLEDSVPEEAKDEARMAARAVCDEGFAGKLVAVRVNASDSAHFAADREALAGCGADFVVLPKIDGEGDADFAAAEFSQPILCMIESPAALYSARAIAAHDRVAGLIAGTNDLALEMGSTPGPAREGLELALQTIVLAAAAARKACFDGVYNALEDEAGLAAECAQGRAYGFTGKTLIHPGQIAVANRAFSPSDEAVEDARALVEAAEGGAQRFRGRMVEDLHVEQARRILARADACGET